MRRFNGIYLLVLLIFSNSVFSGIGINGGPCQYSSLTAAIAAANAGDTLYINPGNYISYIGDIDKDLTLVPGAPAAPDNSGCETELLTADSSAVVINGNGASHDIHGGLGKISNAAQVVFRHLTLDNATAANGGLLAVIEGASLTLDGVRAMNGNATANGGLIWVNSSIAQPSELRLINNSQLYYGEAVGHGGVIAMDNSELYVSSSSLGGTAGNASSVAGQLGGILYLLNSEAGIYGSSTQLNWGNAGVDGGAIYADYSNVTFNNGEIRNNTANNNGCGVAQRQGFLKPGTLKSGAIPPMVLQMTVVEVGYL